MAIASGGLTDTWRGCFRNTQVVIKAFRIYPPQHLKEATEVNNPSTCEVCSQTIFSDYLDTGTDMDETISPKHPTIPWNQHDALSAFPHLRLERKWQHYTLRKLTSPRVSPVAGA